jgi:DNA-binding GntR family transcriptional regulator
MTAPRLAVKRIDAPSSFRNQAYLRLKDAIAALNLYAQTEEIRLDERRLSHELGVSRTPIREAVTLLEREGFVKTLPRRGIIVLRKTKREIVEMIQVWAALESQAARLVAQNASDADIRSLRALFENFRHQPPEQHLDEYSDANIKFHQKIIHLSGNAILEEITQNLFIHMRAIRHATIRQDHRAERSIVDHMNIIEALEKRDTARASDLVLRHALDLAIHVEKHVNYLD